MICIKQYLQLYNKDCRVEMPLSTLSGHKSRYRTEYFPDKCPRRQFQTGKFLILRKLLIALHVLRVWNCLRGYLSGKYPIRYRNVCPHKVDSGISTLTSKL